MAGTALLKKYRTEVGRHFGLDIKEPSKVRNFIHGFEDGEIEYKKVPRGIFATGVYDCVEVAQRFGNAFACRKRLFSAVWDKIPHERA